MIKFWWNKIFQTSPINADILEISMKFGWPKKEEQGEDVGSTAWLYLIAGSSVERWPEKTEILRGWLRAFVAP
jgi:hypothetical protein